jgi:hypothetical protein
MSASDVRGADPALAAAATGRARLDALLASLASVRNKAGASLRRTAAGKTARAAPAADRPEAATNEVSQRRLPFDWPPASLVDAKKFLLDSIRIRPTRLSAPLPFAGLVSQRTWQWIAAAGVIGIALAATSPLIWRQQPTTAVPTSQVPATTPRVPPAPAAASRPTPPPTISATPQAQPQQPQPRAEPQPAPPAAAPPPRPLSNPEIVAIQTRLRRLGFNPGPADGGVGPRTVAAVREFQMVYGLPVTGNVDSQLFDDVAARPTR